MSKKKQALQLREETGCGLADCMKAIEYCEEHPDCIPLAYLKVKFLAVYRSGDFYSNVKKETEILLRS